MSRKETLLQRRKKFHIKVGREADDTDLKECMSIYIVERPVITTEEEVLDMCSWRDLSPTKMAENQ